MRSEITDSVELILRLTPSEAKYLLNECFDRTEEPSTLGKQLYFALFQVAKRAEEEQG